MWFDCPACTGEGVRVAVRENWHFEPGRRHSSYGAYVRAYQCSAYKSVQPFRSVDGCDHERYAVCNRANHFIVFNKLAFSYTYVLAGCVNACTQKDR